MIAKKENPVWIPPEWHYAEVAQEHGLKLAVMKPGKTLLSNGNWLEVRGKEVGVVDATTASNVYDKLVVPAGVALDEANVPEEMRWMILAPSVYGQLQLDPSA